MKLLRREKRRFLYYPYTGLDSDLNSDGIHTGEYKPVYGDPVEYRGNISAPSGTAAQAFDGLEIRYTHVLLMDNMKADINEYGKIVWKEKPFSITAVRRSFNVINIALLEQTEDHGDQYSEPYSSDGGI